ncbi:hypothetical protein KQX54_021728 [Cotesia glomerata]|uniref:Uncharacterized protein n=1 Tax=Cotesia glomerata TaxID=32391 RepID=A0AAV7JAD1_COTGL|nr:hypothetical protein KQX54_021728 [Cotesia glomerata]
MIRFSFAGPGTIISRVPRPGCGTSPGPGNSLQWLARVKASTRLTFAKPLKELKSKSKSIDTVDRTAAGCIPHLYITRRRTGQDRTKMKLQRVKLTRILGHSNSQQQDGVLAEQVETTEGSCRSPVEISQACNPPLAPAISLCL